MRLSVALCMTTKHQILHRAYTDLNCVAQGLMHAKINVSNYSSTKKEFEYKGQA